MDRPPSEDDVTGGAGWLRLVEGADFGVPVEDPPDALAAPEVVEPVVVGAEEDDDEEDDAELVIGEPFVPAVPVLPGAVGPCWCDAAVPAAPPLVHIMVPAVTNATATTAEPMATPVVERMRRPARCPLSGMSSGPFPASSRQLFRLPRTGDGFGGDEKTEVSEVIRSGLGGAVTTTDHVDSDLSICDLFIGGKHVPAEGGRYVQTTEALTGRAIARVAAASAADARTAASAAAGALEQWSGLPPAARREVLQRAAVLLGERADELAALMGREMGGTRPWGLFNVHLAKGMLAEAAAQAYAMVGEVIPSDVPGLTALGMREPAGVVVGIAPWNAPLILGVRAIAMPLVYGNTVVLKSSEQTPCTHAAIVEVLHEAGVPAGAVNLISNAPQDAGEIVEALIAHRDVARVNFTGSTRVGRIVGELAGRHLTRAVLELGGKAPMIVLEDADLEQAAAAATFGAFMNQGEICMSTERVIADRAIVGEVAAKLAERAAQLVVGPPDDPASHIGPMVNAGARDQVMALVEDARSLGAEVLTGGTAEGLYVRPTVLRGVTPEMRIYREESFGPVVSVIEVDGVDEAVRVANDTDYGLSAAVFGRDSGAALQVARRVRSGICHINSTTVHDEPQMPFGGVGASGWGRFGSRAALEEFTELRWVTIQSGERHYPI